MPESKNEELALRLHSFEADELVRQFVIGDYAVRSFLQRTSFIDTMPDILRDPDNFSGLLSLEVCAKRHCDKYDIILEDSNMLTRYFCELPTPP